LESFIRKQDVSEVMQCLRESYIDRKLNIVVSCTIVCVPEWYKENLAKKLFSTGPLLKSYL